VTTELELSSGVSRTNRKSGGSNEVVDFPKDRGVEIVKSEESSIPSIHF